MCLRTWLKTSAGFALVCSLVLTSCNGHREGAPASSSDVIQGAEKIALYEGLPHQNYESKALKQEQKKPTVEFLKYPFYKVPLKIAEDDASKLTKIFADANTLAKWSGEKKCGGFHPDYAIEWRKGSKKFIVLVCFGCGEVKTIESSGNSRFDIETEAERSLRDVLKKYRVNRPKRKKTAP